MTLNHAFECSGMWIMPMKNVINPESAHLTIVNKTIGVKNLVPSQINWLETGEKFVSFDEMNRQNQSVLIDNKHNKSNNHQLELTDTIITENRSHKGMYLILLLIIGFIIVCIAF